MKTKARMKAPGLFLLRVSCFDFRNFCAPNLRRPSAPGTIFARARRGRWEQHYGRRCAAISCWQSWSQRSLYSLSACPLTQTNSTSCLFFASSSLLQRSVFLTGSFPLLFQPFRIHPSIHFSLKAFTRYCESEYSLTRHGFIKAFKIFG